jgi:ornithine cyclodeaminase/alanine dehydrogenase-like protein (mu-crystallin family)
MLVVNDSEVRQILTMKECIQVMEEALISLARGEVLLPLRPVMWLPEKVGGALAMMPSYRSNPSGMAVKIISVFPGNRDTPYDSHQGAILLFDTAHGQMLAMIDASSVTAIRTAAVSGVATKWLAREDANDLAILGSGVQARTHLESMLCCRNIKRIRVWSRNPGHAREFAAKESERLNVMIDAFPEGKDAVKNAQIVCTTTSSQHPILLGNWIAPGAHINAVGASIPTARELDSFAVSKSCLFVDRRESALNEAGDFLIPRNEGLISEAHVLGELGEVLLGGIHGRRTPQEITLFKSVGIAIEDLAAAQFIYRKAVDSGIGTRVEIGGSRHATS